MVDGGGLAPAPNITGCREAKGRGLRQQGAPQATLCPLKGKDTLSCCSMYFGRPHSDTTPNVDPEPECLVLSRPRTHLF